MAQTREIPVYLFTGFLDAGKTTFIQETLEDPQFNDGQKTLILLCEEGETELSPIKFAASGCKIVTVDEEEQLTESYLADLQEKLQFERVVVEYNGMWLLDTFYSAMPPSWTVYQEMTFADARTYLTYNANMRNLTVDKMKSTETIVFKHFTKVMDKMAYHKIVRAINRRCDIIYEYGPNDVEIDNIEDPLPFDLTAPVIAVADNDYAVFYRDLSEEMDKYNGKTVKFKGLVARDPKMPANMALAGRHVMTCCEADIAYNPLVCVFDQPTTLKTRDWVTLTGKIRVEKNRFYRTAGPVLYVTATDFATPPVQEVATFY